MITTFRVSISKYWLEFCGKQFKNSFLSFSFEQYQSFALIWTFIFVLPRRSGRDCVHWFGKFQLTFYMYRDSACQHLETVYSTCTVCAFVDDLLWYTVKTPLIRPSGQKNVIVLTRKDQITRQILLMTSWQLWIQLYSDFPTTPVRTTMNTTSKSIKTFYSNWTHLYRV